MWVAQELSTPTTETAVPAHERAWAWARAEAPHAPLYEQGVMVIDLLSSYRQARAENGLPSGLEGLDHDAFMAAIGTRPTTHPCGTPEHDEWCRAELLPCPGDEDLR